MSTSEHTLQRKAAIASGGVADHAGSVTIKPLPDFDLGRTIFHTLQGALPRFVIKTRIAKEAQWSADEQRRVERQYQHTRQDAALPAVPEALRGFLLSECDFDMEHADGSFLDHLHFCYEYTHQHYHRHHPERDPVVMLLHSILGTGTNTFALAAEKMNDLSTLIAPPAWRHVQVFPSMLRLLYDLRLRRALRANLERLDALKAVRCHRVIDNAPLELDADTFWVHLNYQLIHLVDFVPVSNWRAHRNDSAFIVFRDLHQLLREAGWLEAQVGFDVEAGSDRVRGERRGLGARAVDLIPVSLSEKMAAKSVRRFSSRIEHSLDYELVWE